MLHEFLKTIRDGRLQSLLDITRKLQITTAMALQMAEDLTRKGYLQEQGAECSTPQSACSECPTGSNCHALARIWFLTEKGQAAISNRDKIE